MAAPVNTVAPSFTGTLRTLVTMTGNAGTWTGSPTFAYQWQRAEPVRHEGVLVTDESEVVTGPWEDIAGATSATYKLLASEILEMVRLRVTATNVDGSTVAYSEQAGPILITALPPGVSANIGTQIKSSIASFSDEDD